MTSDPSFPPLRRLGFNYPATCHSVRGCDFADLSPGHSQASCAAWTAIAVGAMAVELPQFSVPGLRRRLCDDDGT